MSQIEDRTLHDDLQPAVNRLLARELRPPTEIPQLQRLAKRRDRHRLIGGATGIAVVSFIVAMAVAAQLASGPSSEELQAAQAPSSTATEVTTCRVSDPCSMPSAPSSAQLVDIPTGFVLVGADQPAGFGTSATWTIYESTDVFWPSPSPEGRAPSRIIVQLEHDAPASVDDPTSAFAEWEISSVGDRAARVYGTDASQFPFTPSGFVWLPFGNGNALFVSAEGLTLDELMPVAAGVTVS